MSSRSRLPESLSSLESEHHTLIVRTEELFAHQKRKIQSVKNLAGQIQQLQRFAKETGVKDNSIADILNRLGQQIQTVLETGQSLSSKVQELERSAQVSVKTAEKNGRNLQLALMQQQRKAGPTEKRAQQSPRNDPCKSAGGKNGKSFVG